MAAEDYIDDKYWDSCYNDHEDLPSESRSSRRGILAKPSRAEERKFWNGRPVRTMDSDHIMNAILYCEKRFSEAKNHHIIAHDQTLNENTFYFGTVFDMFPDYRHLRDEWERRKAL